MDIEAILKELTLEEKCQLLTGSDGWHIQGNTRLGIEPLSITNGPNGLRKRISASNPFSSEDSIPAVCYPSASAVACTFDTDLMYRMGKAIGEECREHEVSIILGPGVNIKRSPLCGRNFEYLSEDPFLTGRLAASYINGVQSIGVGTTLKHFAANNQETRRLIVDSIVDERALHEIYLPAFKFALQNAQPWTVMMAYNRLNGIYCSENSYLMTELARDTWSYKGAFITDWGALNSNTESLSSGLDVVMPGPRKDYRESIKEDIESKRLDSETFNETILRILTLFKKHNDSHAIPFTSELDEHLSLAQQIAEESTVLLKNDGILPLDPSGDFAVIGSYAEDPHYQGSGSSKVNPLIIDNFLISLNYKDISYSYAPGYDATSGIATKELIENAVALASKKDTVILFAGSLRSFDTEGDDRNDLDIPTAHKRLIEKVTEANLRTIVILQGGAPLSTSWRDKPAAIFMCYLAGCQNGKAITRLLFGDANPSAKLAETWPETLSDTPTADNFPAAGKQVLYKESIFVGYRYYDSAKIEVAYPFGYGLSYTEFKYERLEIVPVEDGFSVSCKVENIGSRFGKEIVQLYLAPQDPGIFKAVQELKGFTKIELSPGESKQVFFKLERDAFAHFCTKNHDWEVEADSYEIRIAASSRDIRLSSQVTVEGESKEEDSHNEEGRLKEDNRKKDDNEDVLHEGLSSYYHVGSSAECPGGVSRFSAKEFRHLYGKPFPKPDKVTKPYTFNTTVADLKDSFLGRIILRILMIVMNETSVDEPEEKSSHQKLMDLPLRALAMSGFDMSIVGGVVDVLNHHFIRGFRRLLTKPKE